MNPYKFFLAIEYYFLHFSLSLHSLLFHSFYEFFCMLSKRENHNFKNKTRENKFENKSKNASHTGFIWI